MCTHLDKSEVMAKETEKSFIFPFPVVHMYRLKDRRMVGS